MSHVGTTLRHRAGRIIAVLLALAFASPTAARADDLRAPSHRILANGLDVTLHDAASLLERMSTVQDQPVITLGGSRYLSVITDVSDAAIYNKGDGEFHPFDEETVMAALAAVSHPHLRLRVTVYLLPYPRRNVLVSSTSGTEIFLSPHVLDIQPEVAAYIATHELGHAFHNTFIGEASRTWDTYREIRGIEDTHTYSELASHPNRPKEIFAEDFRVLFGGRDAVWSGQIENTALASPFTVAGLDEFFRGLGTSKPAAGTTIVASSYPNPFNPETEIRFEVPSDVMAGGERVSVRVYDVTGALVREVYSEVPFAADVRVVWDGRDGRGNPVASAQYFAQIRAGESTTTLKLVMLK